MLPTIAFIFAALESIALKFKLRYLEFVAKPAVMIVLLLWLWQTVSLSGVSWQSINNMPIWFAIAIVFSLAGDIFLMISLDRLFLGGLVSFLLAHIAYLLGFYFVVPATGAGWFALVLILGFGFFITRKIILSLKSKGQNHLKWPIIIYSGVITLMLLVAVINLTEESIWNFEAKILIAIGAVFFYTSDIILAWNKFVTPIQNGRIYNIGAYHIGQILLVAGCVAQIIS